MITEVYLCHTAASGAGGGHRPARLGDFLIGSELAIEVKASKSVSSRDLKGLRALAEEGICKKFYLVSQDHLNRKYEQFHALNWQTFLDQLWEDKLL